MRIGFDARMFGKNCRGIGRYIEELLHHLEQEDSQNEYYIFLTEQGYQAYQPKNKNFTKILAPYRWYSWQEQLFLPILLSKYKLDLVHFPHFNVPLCYDKKFIVTIHDLILLKDSQKRATTLGPFLYGIKKFFYQIVIRRALKKATKIIAVSQKTASDIREIFQIAPAKIEVIYLGVSANFKVQAKLDNSLIFRYNIKKPYLLYIGSAYPHKNLEFLIAALNETNQQLENPLYLYLIGKKDFFYQRLEKLTSPTVNFLGYVPDKDLRVLLQKALLYVFPSRYEGFGLPPLEAMTAGCPVLSSSASCLPEILGDAALFFDPKNPQDLKNKLLQLLNNQTKRQNLITKGFAQIKKYSWSSAAQKTAALYFLANNQSYACQSKKK